VGGVGFVAQAIDDEDGDVTELGPDGGRDGGAVGQVGGPGPSVPVEPESGGNNGTVGNGQGDEGDRAKGERSLNAMGFRADVGGVAMVNVESVIKSLVKTGEGVGIGVDGDAVAVFDGVGAEVIEAGDVVGMAVGVNGGIQTGDCGPKSLGAEIGGSVDNHAKVFIFEPGRGAEAPVPGVR